MLNKIQWKNSQPPMMTKGNPIPTNYYSQFLHIVAMATQVGAGVYP